MDATKTFRHLEYELLCTAKAVDTGDFAPSLIVAKQAWPRRPRAIAMRRGNYVSEEAAIDAAYAQGVEWILNYG